MLRINDPSEAKEGFLRLKSYGFEVCQLVYKPEKYTSEAAKIIKEAANEAGIEIPSQFCGYYDTHIVWDNYYGFLTSGLNVEAYRQSRLEYLMNAASFASEAGIKEIIIHAGFIPNNPFAPEYFSLLTSIELLCDKCKKLNINVHLETGGEAAVALLRLIKDVGRDNLFINLDPANMLMYGYANPIDALHTVGKYVRSIHGKDGLCPKDPRKLGDETPVGEGMVDFYTMFKKLKELGFDRYVIIEREITGDKQIEDILKAKKYFEDIFEKTGY